jgi:hypothetical protein
MECHKNWLLYGLSNFGRGHASSPNSFSRSQLEDIHRLVHNQKVKDRRHLNQADGGTDSPSLTTVLFETTAIDSKSEVSKFSRSTIESKDSMFAPMSKDLFLSGQFLESSTKGRNGRFPPSPDWKEPSLKKRSCGSSSTKIDDPKNGRISSVPLICPTVIKPVKVSAESGQISDEASSNSGKMSVFSGSTSTRLGVGSVKSAFVSRS